MLRNCLRDSITHSPQQKRATTGEQPRPSRRRVGLNRCGASSFGKKEPLPLARRRKKESLPLARRGKHEAVNSPTGVKRTATEAIAPAVGAACINTLPPRLLPLLFHGHRGSSPTATRRPPRARAAVGLCKYKKQHAEPGAARPRPRRAASPSDEDGPDRNRGRQGPSQKGKEPERPESEPEKPPPSGGSASPLRAASEEPGPGSPRESPSDMSFGVAVVVYPLSGVNPWRVRLDPDATIGQLLARLREQMSDEEYRRCERGRLALLGEQSHGQSSWALDDPYVRIMMTRDVRRTLRAGKPLQFTVIAKS